MYGFEMDDHPDAVTSSDNDQLVVVTMTMGEDIEFPSEVQVELTVDGYSMEVCEYSSSGDGSDVDGPKCYYSVSNDGGEDSQWEAGETITILRLKRTTVKVHAICKLRFETVKQRH